MPEPGHVCASPAAARPPVLPNTRRVNGRWSLCALPLVLRPIVVVLIGVFGAVFVRVCIHFQVPLPFCILRRTTGIPCPGCGATRSLLAWTHLDPISALRFNPLFFFAAVGVMVWLGAVLMDELFDTRLVERGRRWRHFLSARWLFTLGFLNWIYLCLTLPP